MKGKSATLKDMEGRDIGRGSAHHDAVVMRGIEALASNVTLSDMNIIACLYCKVK